MEYHMYFFCLLNSAQHQFRERDLSSLTALKVFKWLKMRMRLNIDIVNNIHQQRSHTHRERGSIRTEMYMFYLEFGAIYKNWTCTVYTAWNWTVTFSCWKSMNCCDLNPREKFAHNLKRLQIVNLIAKLEGSLALTLFQAGHFLYVEG